MALNWPRWSVVKLKVQATTCKKGTLICGQFNGRIEVKYSYTVALNSFNLVYIYERFLSALYK